MMGNILMNYNNYYSIYLLIFVTGLSKETMRDMRMTVPRQMLADVQGIISNHGDVNLPNDEGVTLVILYCIVMSY